MKIELSDKEIELLINSLEVYLDCANYVDRTYKSEIVQKRTQEMIIDTAILSNKLYKEKENNMEDYKVRFINEYKELKVKRDKLANLLKGYKEKTLSFTPTCSYELLNTQLMIMNSYLAILEERARLEKVDLNV